MNWFWKDMLLKTTTAFSGEKIEMMKKYLSEIHGLKP